MKFSLPVGILPRVIKEPNLVVYYPLVSIYGNERVERKINNCIYGLSNDLTARQGYYSNPSVQVSGWFEIKTNARDVLSLNLGSYGYPPGAAHGMTYIKSLTFDYKTGMLYSLGSLFKPDSNYVDIISGIVRRQISERKIPLLGDFRQIRPDQDFYIADKALVIYFQLYEISPYYIGLPMFPISVFELEGIITEDGPLGRMATNS